MLARVGGNPGENPQHHRMLALTLRYAAFALIAVIGPGLALQRVARVAVDHSLVLPLGLAFTAGACWLSLAAGIPWIYPVLVAAAWAALLVSSRRPWMTAGAPIAGAVPAIAATVLLLAVTQY